ncbi:hypothetical protein RRF57_007700 [Xylaria bambusicola]|uniref:Uncharacterized protein n=1 Tax=Xylaria bambusicola TaxID=326684 RepID=A0AAN7ZAL2_9PEZI
MFAREEIRNYRVITLSRNIPDLVSHPSNGLGITNHFICRIWLLDIRLLLDAAKIFLQTIKQEAEEFLGILLSITCELRRMTADNVLELPWCKSTWRRVFEHFLEQMSIYSSDIAVVGKDVGFIQFLFPFAD